VGKSTLFNRLAGKKLALVNALPGVTRDRREGEARLGDLAFKIIDTAGLEEGGGASLPGRMRAQTGAALDLADAIFFVFDSRAGLTPADRFFASLVRRANKPLILIANKAEGRAGALGALEGFDLGLGEPLPLSAEHGDGFAELYTALREALPEISAVPAEPEEDVAPLQPGEDEDGSELDRTKPLRIAIIGRPNVGKSTLLNRLLGQERLLTGPEPGLTRDTIGIDFEWQNRQIKMFDTAGLRKRARVADELEKLAGADAMRAVKFAEVVVLLVDATIPFEKQDLTLADLVEREGRALVICLNKLDLIEVNGATLPQLRAEAGRLLPQVKGAPVMP
ncbi:MAG: ribosome biogenesis GTPase Der, partial [Methylocella sp.]